MSVYAYFHKRHRSKPTLVVLLDEVSGHGVVGDYKKSPAVWSSRVPYTDVGGWNAHSDVARQLLEGIPLANLPDPAISVAGILTFAVLECPGAEWSGPAPLDIYPILDHLAVCFGIGPNLVPANLAQPSSNVLAWTSNAYDLKLVCRTSNGLSLGVRSAQAFSKYSVPMLQPPQVHKSFTQQSLVCASSGVIPAPSGTFGRWALSHTLDGTKLAALTAGDQINLRVDWTIPVTEDVVQACADLQARSTLAQLGLRRDVVLRVAPPDSSLLVQSVVPLLSSEQLAMVSLERLFRVMLQVVDVHRDAQANDAKVSSYLTASFPNLADQDIGPADRTVAKLLEASRTLADEIAAAQLNPGMYPFSLDPGDLSDVQNKLINVWP